MHRKSTAYVPTLSLPLGSRIAVDPFLRAAFHPTGRTDHTLEPQAARISADVS